MMSADGKPCISQHDNVIELGKFIECLAVSLNIPNAPFDPENAPFDLSAYFNCSLLFRERAYPK